MHEQRVLSKRFLLGVFQSSHDRREQSFDDDVCTLPVSIWKSTSSCLIRPKKGSACSSEGARFAGQLDTLERALYEGAECVPVLQQLVAIRDAINGVMAGVLKSRLREEFTHHAGSEEPPGSIVSVANLVRTHLR
jgi:FrmR/RcnR family transcriptional regulator, repressor of frmRAB operon